MAIGIDAIVHGGGSRQRHVQLYIEPMLKCDRDFDFIRWLANVIAVSGHLSIPRHLPRGFDNRVMVGEMIDTDFPGYVTLNTVGWLIKRLTGTSSYNFTRETAANQTLIYTMTASEGRVFSNGSSVNEYFLRAARCLLWPTQADEWTRRHRQHGWPEPSIIDSVVNAGCDLVQLAPHRCRQDEFMRRYFWKFSFSRAESLLLNSWTPKQQIVYHVLRHFMHKSGVFDLKDAYGHRWLTTYSIKTLMLWTYERKDSCWWHRSNVVELCSNILKLLLHCCRWSSCKTYTSYRH